MMAIATKELTKREQLQIIFSEALIGMLLKINKNAIKWRMENQHSHKVADTIKETTNVMLKEVSIRTDLR